MLLIGLALGALGRAASASPLDLVRASDCWPNYVELTAPFAVGSEGRVLPVGRRAVLLRVEAAGVLVDFGREGVATVPIEATNLRALAEALREAPPRPFGIFAESMTGKFFRMVGGQSRPCLADELQAPRYFLVLYSDVGSEGFASAHAALKALHSERAADLRDCSVLLFPFDRSEPELVSDLQATGWSWPVNYQFLARSYVRVLSHGATSDPTLLLLDDNGRIVARWSEDDSAPLRGFVDQVPSLLTQDRAERAR